MKKLLLILLIACISHSCNDKRRSAFSTASAEIRSSDNTQDFTLDANKNRILDILIVVDTSTSMANEHTFLETGLEPLLSAIEHTDWRIAVTTSEPKTCFLDRIITPTSDAAAFGQLIRDAVADSAQTTGREQVALATIRALRGECLTGFYGGVYDPNYVWYRDSSGKHRFTRCAEKKNWVRNRSTLVVLMISDEDNQYASGRIGGKLVDLYFYLESIRKIRSTAHVYGLLNPSLSTNYNAWKDTEGESLFTLIGDVCENCQEDQAHTQYKKVVDDMANSVVTILSKNFTLDHTHDDNNSSVVLYYGDGESKNLTIDVDYKIEGKTLILLSNLPEGSKKITVSYSYDPDA